MTIQERLKEIAERVRNVLGCVYFVEGSDSDGCPYKVDCINDRWVVTLDFGDNEHGVIIKNAIIDDDRPVAVDVAVFRNDDPTDIILTEEEVDLEKVPDLVFSFYKKYNDPNNAICNNNEDIADLCEEIHKKTGFNFRAHLRDNNTVIDCTYNGGICYFAVEDIKLTNDSKVEKATVTLKYDDMPIQKVHLSFGNIPRNKIARSIDKLYWMISGSIDTPYETFLEMYDMGCF